MRNSDYNLTIQGCSKYLPLLDKDSERPSGFPDNHDALLQLPGDV